MFFAARDGTVHEGADYSFRKRPKSGSQSGNQSHRLFEHAPQFPEDRRPRLCLKVSSAPILALLQYATLLERAKFALQAGWPSMKEVGQFGEIPPLFWPGQSCRKHTLSHARKEAIQCWGILTHNAYIITQVAYIASAVSCGPFADQALGPPLKTPDGRRSRLDRPAACARDGSGSARPRRP